jgi:aminoglycoside/choline kinase family phosphotransferase
MPEAAAQAATERRIRRLVREALGAEPRAIEWLTGQLGLRRFARVHLDDRTLVARVDAPEDPASRPDGVPPEPPLEPIRSLLEREGLPVPARYGASDDIELLEDVGDRTLARAVANAPATRRALYAQACALVPRIQRIADPGSVEAFSRHLDDALFAYKADLFARTSLVDAGPAAHRCVTDAFERIARAARRAPRRLAHRDFQSANLHVRDDGSLVMIDLQGAFLAPPEYDLMCLLCDSYVELAREEIDAHLAVVRGALPDAPEPETFRHRFDLLTLSRKGKDHARFLSAARQRGDRRFLEHIPATVRHLRRAAADVAGRDADFEAFAELVHALPETPCAP